VVTKLAIQMNCKLGGVPWAVKIPLKNIMVVGMDFYKDSSARNKSVAAFVASYNGNEENNVNCTKFFSRCQITDRGDEFSSSLQQFMEDALKCYDQKNGKLPDRVFVYRDGISDGQFNLVEEFEIPQMRRAFTAMREDYTPGLTVIIVKKRSNSRFFWKHQRNEFENAPIGTAISADVVKNPGQEFYLISQSSNQGTVSPTHFHVIVDENIKLIERLQSFTYRFTHLYFNWPGQIRVPAPCHYAQKLAHLVGESLHQPHSNVLDEKLFYL